MFKIIVSNNNVSILLEIDCQLRRLHDGKKVIV